MVLRRTWCHAIRSAYGYKRTFSHTLNYVCFTPESGHTWWLRQRSAFDPKRTLRLSR